MKCDATTKIYQAIGIKINQANVNKYVKAVIINFGDERGDIIVENDNFGTRRKYADFTNCNISLVLPTGRKMYNCMEGSHDHQTLLKSNDFCSYGERKEGADNGVTVRHGRWIDKGGYAVCTECDGRSGTQYDGVEPIPLMTQFCPNCCAKMDGGAD